MSYTFTNQDLRVKLENADWWRVAQVKALCAKLRRVDYSVVSSRREGHEAVNEFVDEAVPGEKVFGTHIRFPNDIKDVFVTEGDTEFNDLLTALSASLSFRTTAVAKDTAQVTGRNASPNANDRLDVAQDQGNQDSVKRFEELTKQLCKYRLRKDCTWRRYTFESATGATWAAGGTPPPPTQ